MTWTGEEMRKLRRRIPESRAAFARRIGVTRRTVQNLEDGTTPLRLMHETIFDNIADEVEGFICGGEITDGDAVQLMRSLTLAKVYFEQMNMERVVSEMDRGLDVVRPFFNKGIAYEPIKEF